MLDGRVYRAGLIAVALAVIVAALSLQDGAGPLGTTLPLGAFDAGAAGAALADGAPDGADGSDASGPGARGATPSPVTGGATDRAQATRVARALRADGFAVRRSTATVGSAHVPQVVAVRAGQLSAAVVVVADRSSGPSGTAVLVELGHVLGVQTERHTIVLASVGGGAGGADTEAVARSLGVPVDAAIVLGRVGLRAGEPVSVVASSWSSAQAPTSLVATVSAALAAQGVGVAPGPGVAAQVLEQAFPVARGAQAPFRAPAVWIGAGAGPGSAATRRGGAVGLQPRRGMVAPLGSVDDTGPAILQSVDALDAAGRLPGPAGYLILDHKLLPLWAVTLLALALDLPVAAASIDALARARRRRLRLTPGLVSALAAGGAWGLAVVVVKLTRLGGLLGGAPDAPVTTAAAPAVLGAGGVALLVALGAVTRGRPRLVAALTGRLTSRDEGGTVAAMALLGPVALALGVVDPWAALLLAPTLHIWTCLLRLPRSRVVALAVWALGSAAAAAVPALLALNAHIGAAAVLQNGVLMIADGHMGLLALALWCLVGGCAAATARAAGR